MLNADSESVERSRGLCASFGQRQDKSDWDCDDGHLCCCEKLLKLSVSAHWTFSLSSGTVRAQLGRYHELSAAELSPVLSPWAVFQ